MLDVHEVSSKLVLISESQRGYKKMLKEALLLVLRKNEDDQWLWSKFSAHWEDMGSRDFEYGTFDSYLRKWCVFTRSELEDIFHDDAHLLPLLQEAATGKHGGEREGAGRPKKGEAKEPARKIKRSNPTLEKQERGKPYTLRRLMKKKPDLYTRVVSGELSANAAAIEAGFRRKPSALENLNRAWAKATEDERRAFVAGVDWPG